MLDRTGRFAPPVTQRHGRLPGMAQCNDTTGREGPGGYLDRSRFGGPLRQRNPYGENVLE